MLRSILQNVRNRIGKTRQESQRRESYDAAAGNPRGLLKYIPPEGAFRHVRRAAPADLQPWIEHWWSVQWDLRGCEPFRAETLPHPNVQLTFENAAAEIWGIQTGRFTRMLRDAGRVYGVKFKAGCFRPFLGQSVSAIRNRTTEAGKIFGSEIRRLAEEFAPLEDGGEPAAFDRIAAFLRDRLPPADPLAELANSCVHKIAGQRQLSSVDLLAGATGIPKRSLQRLFTGYVGVPAKWVIRRYRLHDVVEAIQSGANLNWARVAAELGYYDQSHLINEFRSITGFTPAGVY